MQAEASGPQQQQQQQQVRLGRWTDEQRGGLAERALAGCGELAERALAGCGTGLGRGGMYPQLQPPFASLRTSSDACEGQKQADGETMAW